MSKRSLLRALVTQRLSAAAEDICALFDSTIAEFEQEVLLLSHSNSSQQQRPGSQQQRLDSQQHEPTTGLHIMSVRGRSTYIKEEPEEQLQEPEEQLQEPEEQLQEPEEQLQELEEQLQVPSFASVSVKVEDDELAPVESDREEQTDGSDLTDRSEEEEWLPEQTKRRRRSGPDACAMDHAPFSCLECGETMERRADISRHMKKHARQKRSNKSKPAAFGAKRPSGRGLQPRFPPMDSDDSCLSDSGDEDYAPTAAGDDSSSTDRSSDEDEDGPRASAASTNRERVSWNAVKQQNSEKAAPSWDCALPGAEHVRLPIQYFRDFFDADLSKHIVEQSNLYCTQNNPHWTLKLDQKELEQFVGTAVYMSVLPLPRSRMYWSSPCRVQQVADVMSRDRWEELKGSLHFNDNTTPNHDDKLFKVRPVIDSLLPKFQALPQEQMLCVDVRMVPFKGKSSLKQYNPKKLHKWGYKIYVLCDTKGLVHSFEISTGKSEAAPGAPDIGPSGNVVLKLSQVIEPNVNHLLFFDSGFSSLPLFVELSKRGIPALGSVLENRLRGCVFTADNELKKKGRGAFEEQQALVDRVDLRAVKWFDSGGVTVASTFASAQPVSTVDRWDRKSKQKVSVKCPSIIGFYHKFVGGVEALDALNSHYRIYIRSTKFYHRLFFHFVDMIIDNSWLLYRRDCESLGVSKKMQLELLPFRLSIAQALCMEGKDLTRKRGPSVDVEKEFAIKKRRGPTRAIPTLEVRVDGVGHWPVVERARNRCKLPLCKGQTVIKCEKCNVHLCLNKNNNCFQQFHV